VKVNLNEAIRYFFKVLMKCSHNTSATCLSKYGQSYQYVALQTYQGRETSQS